MIFLFFLHLLPQATASPAHRIFLPCRPRLQCECHAPGFPRQDAPSHIRAPALDFVADLNYVELNSLNCPFSKSSHLNHA